jgi:hypothetical protein
MDAALPGAMGPFRTQRKQGGHVYCLSGRGGDLISVPRHVYGGITDTDEPALQVGRRSPSTELPSVDQPSWQVQARPVRFRCRPLP